MPRSCLPIRRSREATSGRRRTRSRPRCASSTSISRSLAASPTTAARVPCRARSPSISDCHALRTRARSRSPTEGSRSSARPTPATKPYERRCPALLTTALTFGEPRYASLKGIMGAKKKTIATMSLADLALEAAGRHERIEDRAAQLCAAAASRERPHRRSGRRPRRRSSDLRILCKKRSWLGCTVKHVIVYVEHRQGSTRKVTFELATEARRLADQLGGKAPPS